MSAVNNYPPMCFADYGDSLEITATTDEVDLDVVFKDPTGNELQKITGKFVAQNGVVKIDGLQDLVNKMIESGVDDVTGDQWSNVDRYILMVVTVDGVVTNHTILYLRGDINYFATKFKYFPVLMRERHVMPTQFLPVYIPNFSGATMSILLSLAYIYNNMTYYKSITVAEKGTEKYIYDSFDLNVVLKRLSITDTVTPLYIDVELLADGTRTDGIRYYINDNHYQQQTEFAYINKFGVMDDIVLTGQDEIGYEIEAEYGYAGKQYIRFDDKFISDHKCNTGWINTEERAAVIDMLTSPWVAVVKNNDMKRITITDVKSSIVRPTNKPDNISFTYRYSDEKNMIDNTYKINTGQTNVFSKPPYDKSFE
jgi:hypothetical protein